VHVTVNRINNIHQLDAAAVNSTHVLQLITRLTFSKELKNQVAYSSLL